MIFLTVGTHEQQFNRLINEFKDYIAQTPGEYVTQFGYSTCTNDGLLGMSSKLLGYREMNIFASKAKIIITHGGPASIFLAHKYNKIPIVVPRLKKFNEHVDDHQLYFSRRLSQEGKVIIVENIEDLSEKINTYEEICSKMENPSSYQNDFVYRFSEEVYSLFSKEGITR